MSNQKKFVNFNEVIAKSQKRDNVDIKLSKKTDFLKSILSKKLAEEGKYIGFATDLGCCFYDAVAQGKIVINFL